MHRYVRHVFTLALLVLVLAIMQVGSGTVRLDGTDPMADFDPFVHYGLGLTIVLYVMRLLTLIPLPISISNFIGIVFFNTQNDHPKLKTSVLFGPFVCFRVVTKGTYPELVKKNVQRNTEMCSRLGLSNYVLEVVSDAPLGLPKSPHVRELVVPTTYRTAAGTLYKARALQYCLEEGINILSDNDWIVHLDEETLVTESSLIGIINFIHDGQYQFGQGVITYANEEVVSWVTTLADLVRVGMDYGALRFTLGILHRPLFSWKGSFIVASHAAERAISYDFGPEGSIAEDCCFALKAWSEGFSFGLVEGEMWEKSTFSVMDYIRQRKRWVQGICLVFHNPTIRPHYKLGISVMVLAWVSLPLTAPNLVLVPLYPLPMPLAVNALMSFMGGVVLFLFLFGAMKSFESRRRTSLVLYVLLCLSPILILPVSIVMESIGVVWALLSCKPQGFHIVRKELGSAVVTV